VTLDTRPLAGRRALVTGGAKRIGRAIALELANAGAEVAITFRGSDAEAQQTVHALQAAGARAFAVNCDVRSEASVNEAVLAAVEQLGGLDLLVNNAGAFETACARRDYSRAVGRDV
jgi:NAD(P)-dependent dehydrogenase (short-subunit alcohol dehydrogenase family)